MRRAAIAALALVVAGGLWLSASSTLALADRHDVPVLAAPALVVVLEVAAVIGTALWVTAEPADRRDPAIVVSASCAVAGVGGWSAYGWVGLIGPAAVVFVAHMTAKRWAALAVESDRTGPVVAAPGTGGAPIEQGRRVDRSADDESGPPGPAPGPPGGTGPWSDDEVLSDLRRRGEVEPTPRSLRSRYGMRHDRAVRLVGALGAHGQQWAVPPPDRVSGNGGGTGGPGVVR